jgi:hypothetical protein
MRSAAVGFLLWVLLFACGAVTFDREEKIPMQTIPGTHGPLAYSYAVLIPKQDTGLVTSATLKSMTFQVTDMTVTFDFVDSVHVYAESFYDDGMLPKIEIASSDPVPRNISVLSLDVNHSEDVLPYLEQGSKITIVAKGHFPDTAVGVEGSVIFTVRL